MRLSRVIPTALAALLALALYLAPASPSESHATPLESPSPTSTLPPCPIDDETGAGMALCWWDAQAMGNGEGTSVVSGDCAPMIMGEQASKECVRTHALPSRTEGDATIPNGADLVAECLDIYYSAKHDSKMQIELQNEGWNLTKCFKAWQ